MRLLWMSILSVGVLWFASPALAGNWGENWGSMIWGSVAAVPSLEGFGVWLLVIALFATAAWRLRRRSLYASLMLVLLALVPMLMAPHYSTWNGFTNGEVADADKVNENFMSAAAALDNFETRVGALEASALPATVDASGVNFGNHLDVSGNLTSSGSEGGIITANRGAGTIVVDPTDVTSGYTATLSLDDQGIKLGHNSGVRDIQFQIQNTTKMALSPHGNLNVNGNITSTNLSSHFSNASAHHVPLDEAQVVAFVANNGFSIGAHTTNTNTQLSEAQVDAFVENGAINLSSGSTVAGTTFDNGSVGINEATPGAKLHIKQTQDGPGGGLRLEHSTSANSWDIYSNPDAALKLSYNTVGLTTFYPSGDVRFYYADLFDVGTLWVDTVEAATRIYSGSGSFGTVVTDLISITGGSGPSLEVAKLYADMTRFSGDDYSILNYSSGIGVKLVSGATSWSAQSDERHKIIEGPILNALEVVSNLRTVYGRYLNDPSSISRSFMIAQDVARYFPEASDGSDPDALAIRYAELIPLHGAAIKELKSEKDEEIQSLRIENEKMRADIELLKQRLEGLESL